MQYKKIYLEFARLGGYLKSMALLLTRIILAYGFYEPAMMKWKDMNAVSEWFGSMGMPFPTLNAYMAATTEITGMVLLTLGFLTRLISLPMIVIMVVAIVTVHWENGFSAGANGFEIPLYYMLFLLILVTFGAGKFSLDRLIFKEEA
jgi:putative oxidoreductase